MEIMHGQAFTCPHINWTEIRTSLNLLSSDHRNLPTCPLACCCCDMTYLMLASLCRFLIKLVTISPIFATISFIGVLVVSLASVFQWFVLFVEIFLSPLCLVLCSVFFLSWCKWQKTDLPDGGHSIFQRCVYITINSKIYAIYRFFCILQIYILNNKLWTQYFCFCPHFSWAELKDLRLYTKGLFLSNIVQ